MMNRIGLAAGLVTALGISGACENDRAQAPAAPPGDPDRAAELPRGARTTPPPPAPPTTPSAPDRQTVSGSDITYTTDDGTERAVTDPAALTALEQKLAREGLYNGSVDGTSSPALAAALEQYRARNDLGTGSVVDRKTSNRLGLDWGQVTAGSAATGIDTDIRSAGAKLKSGVERAGDKLEDGVHKTSEKLKAAAHDVKEDFKK